jgi:glycosyltransferase involved in cell wall biosynthesis
VLFRSDEDRGNLSRLRPFCSDIALFPCDPGADARIAPAQVIRHHCPGLTAFVEQRLLSGSMDLVHVEGFYMMQHVPEPSPIPLVLVEQNVEYALWRQRTEGSVGFEASRANLTQYLLTLEAEMNAWRRADVCAALTPGDRAMMRAALPDLDVRLVPDGVDHTPDVDPDLDARRDEVLPTGGPNVVYVANFAYEPNVDATRFLCDVIFPKVRLRRPDAVLWLVGNEPPDEIRARSREGVIEVTGRVPSVAPYLAAADVVVCPLRIGGGVKVKMLEALSHGCAVVTTSVGAQGLGPRAARSMIIEDDPARFAAAIVRLLNRPRVRRGLQLAARDLAATLPTWDDAARALARVYDELITRPRATTQVARRGTASAGSTRS